MKSFSRPQQSPSCQCHLSTKQSFPNTPALQNHILVRLRRILKKACLLHPQVTSASMVTRLPGVPLCTTETPTAVIIQHLALLRCIITLILTCNLWFLSIIKPASPLLHQCDITGRFTLTEDRASMSSFSRFTRHSSISDGNG